MYDILIKGGFVLDGTGSEPARIDVGVKDGRIIDLAQDLTGKAVEVIDATGKFVSPGFIDVHSHCDLVPFMQGEIRNARLQQGITTELIGQCGLGPAPYIESMSAWRQYLKAILGEAEQEWIWTNFSQFLDALEQAEKPCNIAALISHGAVRAQVLGLGNVLPTDKDIEAMQEIVREGMLGGALGISYGLAYLPGVFAPLKELSALSKVVADYEGIMMIHIRSHSRFIREGIEEALNIARESGVKLQISHMRSYANRKFGLNGENLIEMIEQARAEGIDVTFDQHPYRAGSTLLSQVLPPWAKEGGGPQIVERLKHRDIREKLRNELQEQGPDYPGWDNFVGMVGWQNILVTSVERPENKGSQGKTIARIAQDKDIGEIEALSELLISEKAQCCMVMQNLFSEEDIIHLLQHPLAQVGSDGIPTGTPHPRLYGTYPKFLGEYIRDKGILSWPEAIKRITGDPAKRLNLQSRGFINKNYKADLVVFDPETIGDIEDYNNPAQIPKGIHFVSINGKSVLSKGKVTDTSAGQVLRK